MENIYGETYKTEDVIRKSAIGIAKLYEGNPEYDMNHKDFGFKACEICKKSKATIYVNRGLSMYYCEPCADRLKIKRDDNCEINSQGWKK